MEFKNRTYGFWNVGYNRIDTADSLVWIMDMMRAYGESGEIRRYSKLHDTWYTYGTYRFDDNAGEFIGCAYDEKYQQEGIMINVHINGFDEDGVLIARYVLTVWKWKVAHYTVLGAMVYFYCVEYKYTLRYFQKPVGSSTIDCLYDLV